MRQDKFIFRQKGGISYLLYDYYYYFLRILSMSLFWRWIRQSALSVDVCSRSIKRFWSSSSPVNPWARPFNRDKPALISPENGKLYCKKWEINKFLYKMYIITKIFFELLIDTRKFVLRLFLQSSNSQSWMSRIRRRRQRRSAHFINDSTQPACTSTSRHGRSRSFFLFLGSGWCWIWFGEVVGETTKYTLVI